MTMQPSPDLLDLAEAVAAGTLRADDAERQLRLALGPDRAAESEQAVRELRGLIGAAGAVRAHARATREAFDSASPDLAATVAPTPASIATLVPGRVTAGAIHPVRPTAAMAPAALRVGRGCSRPPPCCSSAVRWRRARAW